MVQYILVTSYGGPLVKCRVSDEDYDYLNQWEWKVNFDGYVYRMENGKAVKMAVEVFSRMGLPGKDVVDHKNRRKLNNQRDNLRAATHAENARNRSKHPTSRFIGVRRVSNKHTPWLATIGAFRLGPFADEVQAAKIRDQYAKALYGEFAVLNFPDE